jgi:hypothetical protein
MCVMLLICTYSTISNRTRCSSMCVSSKSLRRHQPCSVHEPNTVDHRTRKVANQTPNLYRSMTYSKIPTCPKKTLMRIYDEKRGRTGVCHMIRSQITADYSTKLEMGSENDGVYMVCFLRSWSIPDSRQTFCEVSFSLVLRPSVYDLLEEERLTLSSSSPPASSLFYLTSRREFRNCCLLPTCFRPATPRPLR